MGNRLSKIYTRTGDDGTTGLGDGSRVRKDSLRIEAIGAVDELNSAIGVLASEPLDQDIATLLTEIQHKLFDLGGELSIPGYKMIAPEHVTHLETALDSFNEHLPPLKDFILPGGSRPAGLCHVARAICRRAERCVVSLAQAESLSLPLRHYLNRLSDLLFVLCRVLNRRAGGQDVLWKKDRPADNAR
ncbi:MAG: cob(I)yrinic acid a,c-diamide adenosyltransferase [Betaproteobacteria bacterium]|nr:cob(I)yrinic acid a,c-diamide adenosyltransferase [Betaproteobacteria bacterium]